MRARIYRPARPATQSGPARHRDWVLDFPAQQPRSVDPLMGWTSSSDTQAQVTLHFETRDAAEAYAQEQGIDYVVLRPRERKPNLRPRGYGENFATDRRIVWTH